MHEPGEKIQTLAHILTTLQQHRITLHDRFHVLRIGVFGSYVRGEMHRGSDVDLLVEFSKPISLLTLVSLENYLSEIIGVKADVVPKEDIRVELKDRILRETVFA